MCPDDDVFERERQEELWREFKWELLGTFGLKGLDEADRIGKLFGEWPECLFNLRMFNSRVKNGPARVYCPPGDNYQPRFALLAKTGAIRKLEPRRTTIEEELGELTIPQLRELAESLGLSLPVKAKKAVYLEALASHPDTAAHVPLRTLKDYYEFVPLPGQLTAKAKYEGPDIVEVPSLTDPAKTYQADVRQWTCTCEDWSKRHASAEPSGPARLCKHLLRLVGENPALITPEMWPHAMLMSDRFRMGRAMPGTESYYGQYQDAERYIISPGPGWINFYIGVNRYGYNPVEKRWAYKKRPDISAHLLAQVRKLGIQPLPGNAEDEEIKDISGKKRTDGERPPTTGAKGKAAPKKKPGGGGCLIICLLVLVFAWMMCF